jgi:hypothetical protein
VYTSFKTLVFSITYVKSKAPFNICLFLMNKLISYITLSFFCQELCSPMSSPGLAAYVRVTGSLVPVMSSRR